MRSRLTREASCGSTCLLYDGDDKVVYRVAREEDGEPIYVDFTFFGALELTLSLDMEAVRRCRDVFTEALRA